MKLLNFEAAPPTIATHTNDLINQPRYLPILPPNTSAEDEIKAFLYGGASKLKKSKSKITTEIKKGEIIIRIPINQIIPDKKPIKKPTKKSTKK